MPIVQLVPHDVEKVLRENPEAVYIDVRTLQEYEQGHVPKSVNIPAFAINSQTGGMEPVLDSFCELVTNQFKKNQKLIVGCKMGGRSQKACEYLLEKGFENLYNVNGGYKSWVEAKLPVTKE